MFPRPQVPGGLYLHDPMFPGPLVPTMFEGPQVPKPLHPQDPSKFQVHNLLFNFKLTHIDHQSTTQSHNLLNSARLRGEILIQKNLDGTDRETH